MKQVSGTFEVTLEPLEASVEGANGVRVGRMSIDKRFHGALEGRSRGEMLSAMTSTPGSAGYVAIEQVDGTLSGRAGSFVLQHFGTLDQGRDRLVLEVVPDSGTGALKGLRGEMTIRVEDGQHHYVFTYELD